MSGKRPGRQFSCLPSLLASEPLVKQRQNLGYVELDIFQIELVLVILLHFQKIIQLEIKLQKSSVTT